jgi:hypothetical protein
MLSGCIHFCLLLLVVCVFFRQQHEIYLFVFVFDLIFFQMTPAQMAAFNALLAAKFQQNEDKQAEIDADKVSQCVVLFFLRENGKCISMLFSFGVFSSRDPQTY